MTTPGRLTYTERAWVVAHALAWFPDSVPRADEIVPIPTLALRHAQAMRLLPLGFLLAWTVR